MSPDRNTPDFGFGTGGPMLNMDQGADPSPRNPIEDLYQTELGRAADPGGLEFWTNAYNNGMSLDDIRDQGFRASQEYTNRQATTPPEVYNPFNGPGNPPEYRNPVEDLYQTELGRAADPGGLEFWTNAYNNGMSLDDIRDQGFRASQEYINRQATPQPAVYPEGYDPVTGTIIGQQPVERPGEGYGYGYGRIPPTFTPSEGMPFGGIGNRPFARPVTPEEWQAGLTGGPFPDRTQEGYPFFQTLPLARGENNFFDDYRNRQTQVDPAMDFVQNIDQQLPYLQRAFQEQLQLVGDPAAAARAVLGSLR